MRIAAWPVGGTVPGDLRDGRYRRFPVLQPHRPAGICPVAHGSIVLSQRQHRRRADVVSSGRLPQLKRRSATVNAVPAANPFRSR